jgi:chromosome segregation ATPase
MEKLRKRNRELEEELKTTKEELDFLRKHTKMMHEQLQKAETERERSNMECMRQTAINDGLRQTIVESILQDCSSYSGSEEDISSFSEE